MKSIPLKTRQHIIIEALEDIKALDIVILDTTQLSSTFDCIILASGSSDRHLRALAKNVYNAMRSAGEDVFGIEGEDTAEWILVDCGEIVTHLFLPTVRQYYRLEELWGPTPVTQ